MDLQEPHYFPDHILAQIVSLTLRQHNFHKRIKPVPFGHLCESLFLFHLPNFLTFLKTSVATARRTLGHDLAHRADQIVSAADASARVKTQFFSHPRRKPERPELVAVIVVRFDNLTLVGSFETRIGRGTSDADRLANLLGLSLVRHVNLVLVYKLFVFGLFCKKLLNFFIPLMYVYDFQHFT
jgi:hypothetical protein